MQFFLYFVCLLLFVVIHGHDHIKENLPCTSINFTIQGTLGSNDSHICQHDNVAEKCSAKLIYISNSSQINQSKSIISWNDIVVYLLVGKNLGGRERVL